VVRGGRNRPEDIRRGIGTHPSGVTGISVECALGLTLQELAQTIPHGQIGVTIRHLQKLIMRCPKAFVGALMLAPLNHFWRCLLEKFVFSVAMLSEHQVEAQIMLL
jgi:hypothetical protein